MASPVIRAAAVFGLGCLVHSLPSVSCHAAQEEIRGPVRCLLTFLLHGSVFWRSSRVQSSLQTDKRELLLLLG